MATTGGHGFSLDSTVKWASRVREKLQFLSSLEWELRVSSAAGLARGMRQAEGEPPDPDGDNQSFVIIRRQGY